MSKAAYDEFADWYAQSLLGGTIPQFHELAISAVRDLAGDVEDEKVCDLACGQGIFARLLADSGAEVIGIDISEGLLDIARDFEYSGPGSIAYVRDDAQEMKGVADESFDMVVCNLALMDIPDIETTFQAVNRVLRKNGSFVFSIIHPCFLTPGSPRWIWDDTEIVGMDVRRYFEEGYWRRDGAGIRAKVGSHHRTLSSYMNTLTDSDFVIEQCLEPRATGRIAEKLPGYYEVPGVLAVRSRKGK